MGPYLSHNYRYQKKSRIKSLREAGLFLGFSVLAIMLVLFILGFIAYAFQAQAATGINQQINYQGKLTDENGVAVADGTYNVKFAIYDASSGETCLWTAVGSCADSNIATTTITTVNGIFSAVLGGTGHNSLATSTIATTYNWNIDNLYLGVTIRGTDATPVYDSEMTPRKRITSSVYAFNADLVDGINATSTAAVANYLLSLDSYGNLNLFNQGVSSTYATTTWLYVRSDAKIDGNATTTGQFEAGSVLYAKDSMVGVGIDPSTLLALGISSVFSTYKVWTGISGIQYSNYFYSAFSPTADSSATNIANYINVSADGSYPQDWVQGESINVTYQGTGDNLAVLAGLGVTAELANSSNVTTTYAIFTAINNGLDGTDGGGDMTNAYNFKGNISLGSLAGTVSNFYNVYAVAPSVSGGAITNAYGLYIEDWTAASTLNYPIWTNDGQVRLDNSAATTTLYITGDSYFGGNATTTGRLTLGSTNPTVNAALFSTTGSGNLYAGYFNGDLYVSGNATTSGYLTVGAAPNNSVFANGYLNVENDLAVGGGIVLGGIRRTTWPTLGAAAADGWWATTTNSLIGYPDLDAYGYWAIVLGSSATTTGISDKLRLEVADGDFGVDLGAGYETFFVDSTNHRVGVGTSSPKYQFAVDGESFFLSPVKINTLNATTTNIGTLTVYTGSTLSGLSIINDGRFPNGLNASTTANFLNLKTYGLGNFTDLRSTNLNASTTANFLNLFAYGSATTTGTLEITGYASTTNLVLADGASNLGTYYDLYVNSGNLFFNGSQLTGANGLSFWQYRPGLEKAITPTSTASGIFVTASSTIAANFRVDGAATTTKTIYVAGGLWVATTSPWAGYELALTGDQVIAGNFYNLGSGTTTNAWYVGSQLNVATSSPWTGYEFALTGDEILTGGLTVGPVKAVNFGAGDLYLSDSATTTNSLYVGGTLGVATSSPYVNTKLALTGNAFFDGNATTSGNVYLGTNQDNFIWLDDGQTDAGGISATSTTLVFDGQGLYGGVDAKHYIREKGGDNAYPYLAFDYYLSTAAKTYWDVFNVILNGVGVNLENAADDDYLYFDGWSTRGLDGTEYLAWSDSSGEFNFSDDLYISGNATTTDNLYVGGILGIATTTAATYGDGAYNLVVDGDAAFYLNNDITVWFKGATIDGVSAATIIVSGVTEPLIIRPYGGPTQISSQTFKNGLTIYGNATVTDDLLVGGDATTTGTISALLDTGGATANLTYTAVGSVNLIKKTSSLRKYKSDIDYNGVSPDLVYNLQPISYTFMGTGAHYYGLIAEDVALVDSRFGTWENGEVVNVEWNGIIAALTATAKAQKVEIEELEDQIEILQQTSLDNTSVPLTVIDNPDLNIQTLAVHQAATFYGTLYVYGEAGFMHKVVFEDDIEVKGKIYASADQAGTATILAGATSTEVVFNKEYEVVPKVTATPNNNLNGLSFWITNRTPKGFQINLAQSFANNITFDWIALAVKGQGEPPVINDFITSLDTVGLDIPVELWVQVTDPDTEESKLSYSWKLAPALGIIEGETGLVYWTVKEGVEADTDVTITVTVSDGTNSVSQSKVVRVLAPQAEEEPPLVVLGCLDQTALNYNPEANSDDGFCQYLEPVVQTPTTTEPVVISGCTDQTALNYNTLATQDDGLCTYLEPVVQTPTTTEPVAQGGDGGVGGPE